MLIVGAGLAGLIAANIFPQARITEAQGRDKLEHKALLRFRSTAVADATGIEFRKVRVHKGLWHEGRFAPPSIKLANLYSQKVIGRLADRSIWNLDPVDRYVAPEDFISQMMDNCGNRISFNCQFEPSNTDEPVISTMPMPVLINTLGVRGNKVPDFQKAPIIVSRFRIPDADVFQTIYFPEEGLTTYRASITGSLLIIESMEEILSFETGCVLDAFGISHCDPIDNSKQAFGKIVPIDDAWRKNFILRASVDHGIYSVGRFATWRNILLDDVVQDLSIVKRLIKMGHYQHTKEISK